MRRSHRKGDRYAKYMGAPVVNRSGNQDALEMDSAENPSNKIRRTSRAGSVKSTVSDTEQTALEPEACRGGNLQLNRTNLEVEAAVEERVAPQKRSGQPVACLDADNAGEDEKGEGSDIFRSQIAGRGFSPEQREGTLPCSNIGEQNIPTETNPTLGAYKTPPSTPVRVRATPPTTPEPSPQVRGPRGMGTARWRVGTLNFCGFKRVRGGLEMGCAQIRRVMADSKLDVLVVTEHKMGGGMTPTK